VTSQITKMNKYQLAAQKLNTYQKLDLDTKLFLTHKRIEKALSIYDKPLVSSSFGKDSTVLIHLVMQHTKDFDVVFNETGVQLIETLVFRDLLTELWNLNLHIIKPDTTFWELVKKHGYPETSRNSKTGDKRQPACCKYLKELPMKKFLKEHDYDLNFVGLLADEGRQRRWAYIQKGCCIYESKSWGIAKCIPLIWWSQKDIWEYINRFNLPINEAYEKYGIERTGCLPCTGHIDWEKSMAKTNPKMLRFILKDKCGGQRQFQDFPEIFAN
jgi:phosphoadenosine phosphosulfate reductase